MNNFQKTVYNGPPDMAVVYDPWTDNIIFVQKTPWFLKYLDMMDYILLGDL